MQQTMKLKPGAVIGNIGHQNNQSMTGDDELRDEDDSGSRCTEKSAQFRGASGDLPEESNDLDMAMTLPKNYKGLIGTK